MNKNLLFTGGSGFLGSCTKPLLSKDYNITTIGISDIDNLKFNLAKEEPKLDKYYDVVLHAAGKAHVVPKTEEEKNAFYEVNFNGTKNLCIALEKVGTPKSLIFISTVAVYGAHKEKNVSEEHPLNGSTPYAKSKIQAESFLRAWCKKNNVILTILRPSLLAGPNPPGNLKAMIKGIEKGYYLSIGKANARNCILMAEDIAHLVRLTEEKGGTYNVFDDSRPTYRELELLISKQLGKRSPITIPYWCAFALAKIGDVIPLFPINSYRLDRLLNTTEFSNEKAKRELGWTPLNVLNNFRIK